MRHLTTAALLSLTFLATACPPKKAPVTDPAESGSDDGGGRPDARGAVTQEKIDTLHRNFNRVFFEFDRADLGDDDRNALNENAKIMKEHPSVSVQLQGHTDDYGSDEYNLALGEKRAQAVAKYLQDLGVGGGQLKVVSFGEEKLLVDGGDIDAQSTNRRAEFVVLVGGEIVKSSDAK